MIEIDEPDTALDHPTGQQAVDRELSEDARSTPRAAAAAPLGGIDPVDAVHLASAPRFAREVDQLGSGRLHAESELICGDPAVDLGVADRVQAMTVQVSEGLDGLALH